MSFIATVPPFTLYINSGTIYSLLLPDPLNGLMFLWHLNPSSHRFSGPFLFSSSSGPL